MLQEGRLITQTPIEVSGLFAPFCSDTVIDISLLVEFAMNCGLRFYTPEEYFKGATVSKHYSLSGFNSKAYDHSRESFDSIVGSVLLNTPCYVVPLYTPTSAPLLPRRISEFEDEPLEVVIFVGSPGAGKTSFFAKHFQPKGYVHIVSSPSPAFLFINIPNLKAIRVAESRHPSQSRSLRQTPPSNSLFSYSSLLRNRQHLSRHRYS